MLISLYDYINENLILGSEGASETIKTRAQEILSCICFDYCVRHDIETFTSQGNPVYEAYKECKENNTGLVSILKKYLTEDWDKTKKDENNTEDNYDNYDRFFGIMLGCENLEEGVKKITNKDHKKSIKAWSKSFEYQCMSLLPFLKEQWGDNLVKECAFVHHDTGFCIRKGKISKYTKIIDRVNNLANAAKKPKDVVQKADIYVIAKGEGEIDPNIEPMKDGVYEDEMQYWIDCFYNPSGEQVFAGVSLKDIKHVVEVNTKIKDIRLSKKENSVVKFKPFSGAEYNKEQVRVKYTDNNEEREFNIPRMKGGLLTSNITFSTLKQQDDIITDPDRNFSFDIRSDGLSEKDQNHHAFRDRKSARAMDCFTGASCTVTLKETGASFQYGKLVTVLKDLNKEFENNKLEKYITKLDNFSLKGYEKDVDSIVKKWKGMRITYDNISNRINNVIKELEELGFTLDSDLGKNSAEAEKVINWTNDNIENIVSFMSWFDTQRGRSLKKSNGIPPAEFEYAQYRDAVVIIFNIIKWQIVVWKQLEFLDMIINIIKAVRENFNLFMDDTATNSSETDPKYAPETESSTDRAVEYVFRELLLDAAGFKSFSKFLKTPRLFCLVLA